jgi:hypothetical protein
MHRLVAVAFLVGCGGPSQQQLAETPSATARARPAEAPPASTSDKERERGIQQFDDMQTTQNAYGEANAARQGSAAGSGAGAGSGSGSSAQPKKKGPAEQGYLPKNSK